MADDPRIPQTEEEWAPLVAAYCAGYEEAADSPTEAPDAAIRDTLTAAAALTEAEARARGAADAGTKA